MPAYLQLGHESWNLLDDADIGAYRGVVLSPVNDDPTYVRDRLARLGARARDFEVILDPQLYNPMADRGQLLTWPYYPNDFDTADRSDPRWWANVARGVVRTAADIGANAICTPAPIPRVASPDYYRFIVEVGDATKAEADAARLDTLLTVVVPLRDLVDPRRALELASILTGSDCERIYLVFLAEDVGQREPLNDGAGLASAVHLVRLLSETVRVHVAFSAHELVLWKFAGAADVSSGKWMNVRRFTPGRWRDEEGGGRQVMYWNESLLLTLLRDQDVTRLDREGWFAGRTFTDNPASERILQILRSGSGEAWLRLSWVQYLRWVSVIEARATAGDDTILSRVDAAWASIPRTMLFVDRFNTGDHARIWLNAAREGAGR